MTLDLPGIGLGLGLILLALILLAVSKSLLEWALRLDVDDALFTEDNPAIGLAAAGYYAGVALVLAAALGGEPSDSWLDSLGHFGLYAGAGVALLGVSARVAPSVLLPRGGGHALLVEGRRVGAGLVFGAGGVASGAVVAASMHGSAPGGLIGGLASMTGAFLLGQLSLAALTRLHRLVAHFDVHAEIARDNTAAGCTLAGALVGNAILLHRGLQGDLKPDALLESLAPVGVSFGLGVLLMPLVRLIVSRLFFGGHGFDREIATDRNVAAGALELVAHPTLALILVRALP